MELLQPFLKLFEWNQYTLIVACSTLVWFLVQFLSIWICKSFVGKVYSSLNIKKQREWDTRVVASIHAILITFLSFQIVMDEKMHDRHNKLFLDHHNPRMVMSIASGYFLWDALVSGYFLKDLGYGGLIHGVCCFVVYFCGLTPFANYHGMIFLLEEMSTPFLHMHWFLEKAGRSGKPLHMLNGMILLLTFFFGRVIIGPFYSVDFFYEVFKNWNKIPLLFRVIYLVSNSTLNMLNVYWFILLARGFARRFGDITFKVKKSE